ncbi:tripartite tricarboxylate transporter substrate-binding protein [Xenophilus arseniciresistens]|uniref:Tripartite tricarboxylate transporter substrate-binding protein n=1 Tax=Xenophilus arseniciresistens TaxID=1283306 RepID=A0AAE3SZ40_9BURK|nr:tripartite tricarboxylate transporter substrate-binding protein [Xenophilus arseniciresistens]MDA7415446.1 tripartite tricarboxylate transporter substrate-binding protein [Xenophilus arseniciresistens]
MLSAAGAATWNAAVPLRAFAAQGAGLPVDQVQIYYGFPAGSSGDAVARRIGEKLAGSAYTRKAAVIENKTGAAGRIALESLKSAPADGTVMALAPLGAMTIHPYTYKVQRYRNEDFQVVGRAAVMHHGLAVGPLVPDSVRTLKDFLAWAKANPSKAAFGSPGAGSTPHFIGALLGIDSGIELRHVPYRGSVPGVTDTVGGQIAAMVTPSGDYLPFLSAGKLRVLATSGSRRSPHLPQVPTFAEQGFADLTVEEWFGFYMPAKTPPHIVQAANAAINAALGDPRVADSLASLGLLVKGGTPQEAAAELKADHERWGPLVRKIGFTTDS